MNQKNFAQAIINSRAYLLEKVHHSLLLPRQPEAEEGGCGVTGFACNIPLSGRHIFEPSVQMHNRGNGKGGGIAAVGLEAAKLGVDQATLETDFLLQIALLDPTVLPELESRYIRPHFQIDHETFVPTVGDFRDVPGLEMEPPRVKRYFVQVKPDVLSAFQQERHLEKLSPGKAAEEFVYQNTFQINQNYYSSLGEKKAFVLSHGRNMMILKIVGYAEQVAQYYRLEDFKAHVWMAHQRYPTKGRVWHPGGAHPFSGLDEALVHNGDFANYYSVSEYLYQRNVIPLFLTDTEVSIQVFDLLNRVYGYPLEYIIESLAPTTEMDFDQLPLEKQKIYRQIQATQIHGSPDGPWFFIIARNLAGQRTYQLIGITDTAMLRPQVFALQKGEVEIGLICSEKQAIDATLQSLAKEDPRFGTMADQYWNARGGSYTDGGAFIFTVKETATDQWHLTCQDKFGRTIDIPAERTPFDFRIELKPSPLKAGMVKNIRQKLESGEIVSLFSSLKSSIEQWDYPQFSDFLNHLAVLAKEEKLTEGVIELLTLLLDRRYPTGTKRRRSILQMVTQALENLFNKIPFLNEAKGRSFLKIDYAHRIFIRAPEAGEKFLVINAGQFPPEGEECDARLVVEAYELGWKRFIGYGYRGQRFLGNGLGPETKGVRIDAYGSTGDYLASGIDGLEIFVHGNAQDQLGQIMKTGKLVVHGDVGQTFLYGAKGGEIYVLGNAAGRPLINAVGRPKVVINGTALDFLAESFMAGDPHNGGGFVVVNGLNIDSQGNIVPKETPYPGSNLFSLASGGAIYIRDPYQKIVPEQLNGGELVPFSEQDWKLILPYLQENERLFGISIEDHLLTVDGQRRTPSEVFRTVQPAKQTVLAGGLDEWE
ncbi:MAG: glutamate synthase [Thermodesulfobacteriota bacterium]|jgi:glutamate synthase domain-containing protein 1/glutamate synthase domain-containing protein 3